MRFYAKKTDYFIKSTNDGIFIKVSEKKIKRGILIRYLTKMGAKRFFKEIHENFASACHLKALAADFLEGSLEDFSRLYL